MTNIPVQAVEIEKLDDAIIHRIAENPDTGELVYLDSEKAKFRFKRGKFYKIGESWVLLVYGQSKAGKSWFAGTAGPRVLYINIGDGLDTLFGKEFQAKYGSKLTDDMIIVDIREKNPAGIAEAFDEICNAIDAALKNFPNEFDTIVLDEATAMRKFALSRAIEINEGSRIRKARTKAFVKAEIGDMGVEMQMIEWFLGTYIPIFKEAKKNFLMLAHERQVYGKPPRIGEEAPLKKILPGFTGKTFPDAVPAYFDDVWRMEKIGGGNNVVYRLRTQGSESQLAGSRHGGIFPAEIRDPNYLQLLAKIRNA